MSDKSHFDPLRPSAAFGGSIMPRIAGIEGSEVNSEINVTPMIDVMLVLLIIFMVITPVLANYEAETPRAANVVPARNEDVITLGIDAHGAYYVNGDPVGNEQLGAKLRTIYEGRPDDHLLYLRADEEVGYDVVLRGIDAARGAGVRTIGAISTPIEKKGGR
ncbi:MAG TPA: biopolymer transporter ExbD [Longimicrobiales bacterium]|nr:biopolymer transporter ExbD [Longimicrobiales bacterium]